MFRENGFDDFISKPIDIRLLDKALHTYIKSRHLKTPRKSASDNNSELLRVFLRDAKNALKKMPTDLDNSDYRAFAVTVHGMKSALANVGETDLSTAAKNLEIAAKENDISYITEHYPVFEMDLSATVIRFTAENATSGEAIDIAVIKRKIDEIKAACENYDSNAAALVSETLKFNLSAEIREKLSVISELILHGEFEEATGECCKSLS
jgi:HPt (histidine-containing phosphotransfer) domain-containing protein